MALACSAVASQIPSPESVLGFPVGADRKLADWNQVLEYWQALAAAAPDRVKYEIVGHSTLGKPFALITVSSADNLRQLSEYLEIQRRLADPRGLSRAEAERLMVRGKAVVLMTCTIHSNEVASTQTSMEYVYRLLAEDTPEHRAILNNVIFLLIPSLNPDGQDMVVHWYRKYLGTPYEGLEPVELFQTYTGHDDNRDWYMFTQVETQLTVAKVENVWHPQVVYDVHQDDPNIARLFAPPFLDPIDPNIDPSLVQETNWLGTSIATSLATEGKKGIVTHAAYDEWSPSRHYPVYHAGIRILTESASVALASPVDVPFSALTTKVPGYNAKKSSWNFPDPWPGGVWRLRDIVDDQMIAFESCLFTVAQNREMLLRNFYQIGKKAVEWNGSPYAYLVPATQRDVPATIKLLQTLRMGDVEISRARSGFTADGVNYPAGTFVIPIAQPYGSFARTLLERQRYPDLREYPGGPPKRPYDVTAQTLPLLMGVKCIAANRPFAADLEKVNEIKLPPGVIEPPQKEYLLPADSAQSYRAVNRLLAAGSAVGRLRTALHDRGRNFPAGTFVLQTSDPAAIRNLGLDLFSSDATPPAVPLRAPRIGLYKSYEPSMDEGWTRWLLEQYDFHYTSIFDRDVRASNLKARFDVIVLPDQSEKAIVQGWPRSPVPVAARSNADVLPFRPIPHPEEFTGGIGEAGINSLRQFVRQGGTLVTLNRASALPIQRMGIPVRDVLRKVPSTQFYGPGSILRIRLNASHPLAYGMPQETIAWFERGPAFGLTPDAKGTTAVGVAEYPSGEPLLSGWLLGGKQLQTRNAMMDVRLGRGHIVMFGFRPQYRGQSYATFNLFFNALFYFGPAAEFGRGSSIPTRTERP